MHAVSTASSLKWLGCIRESQCGCSAALQYEQKGAVPACIEARRAYESPDSRSWCRTSFGYILLISYPAMWLTGGLIPSDAVDREKVIIQSC